MDAATDGSAVNASAGSSDCDEVEVIHTQQRPCPIPKPAMIVGKALGFKQGSASGSERDSTVAKPP